MLLLKIAGMKNMVVVRGDSIVCLSQLVFELASGGLAARLLGVMRAVALKAVGASFSQGAAKELRKQLPRSFVLLSKVSCLGTSFFKATAKELRS